MQNQQTGGECKNAIYRAENNLSKTLDGSSANLGTVPPQTWTNE
jgi:hypothetical protein